MSKWKAVILDEKQNGGCIESKPYNGGSKKSSYPFSVPEAAAIVGQNEVVDQQMRKLLFMRQLFYEGRISTKDKLLARCRRPHNRAMIKIGEFQGAVPHVYCKRKAQGESRRDDDDDDEVSDEEELEGIINATHWVYIKIQLCKTDGYGVNSFPNGTDSMSLTMNEWRKLVGILEKFLAKKGINYEVTPANDLEVISDLSDDQDDDDESEDERPAKIQPSKGQKGGRAAKGGGKGGKGGKRGKGGSKGGKKRRGSGDDEDAGSSGQQQTV